MKLTKKQKDKVLAWIGEGLQSDEMNARAAKCRPPFSVSRQQVDFYRDSRGVALDELKQASESEALRTGLALKEERVSTLAELAERLKAELLGDKLWLTRQRALGSGDWQQFITEQHFNNVEINTLRALLDDIAKETNGRTYQRRDGAAAEETLDDEDLEDLSDEELEAIAEGRA
ncbi:MAG: hypothetical protein LC795_15575 [Acidobacteria bacterium]|nr:hypothetical protein [Acidobacteriota bacterium]MCA1620695.1 hypothetical protein [Acidobacteriota bacterium]